MSEPTPEGRWLAMFPGPTRAPMKTAGEALWRRQRREHPDMAGQLSNDGVLLRESSLVQYRCKAEGCLIAAVVDIDHGYWVVRQDVSPVALSAYDIAEVVEDATEGTEWLDTLLQHPQSVVGMPVPVDDAALQVLAGWLVDQLAGITAVDHVPESVRDALDVVDRGGAYRSRRRVRCIDAAHLVDWGEYRLGVCEHREFQVGTDRVLRDIDRLAGKRRKRVVYV